MGEITLRYALFQRLIAHLQTALYELGEQTESLLDAKEREEIGTFIAQADALIDEALAEVKSSE